MRRSVWQRRAAGSLSVSAPEHAANASCRLVRRQRQRPRPMADSEMADGGFSELGRQESAGARGSGARWDSTRGPGDGRAVRTGGWKARRLLAGGRALALLDRAAALTWGRWRGRS